MMRRGEMGKNKGDNEILDEKYIEEFNLQNPFHFLQIGSLPTVPSICWVSKRKICYAGYKIKIPGRQCLYFARFQDQF